MIRKLVICAALVCAGGGGAAAQDAGGPGFDPVAFAEGLPASTVRQMRDSPARFLGQSADLVLAYGADGAIDAEAIERAIGSRRAAARAEAMARLLAADLDDDMTITPAETAVLVAALDPGARGAVLVAQADADGDGDGAVSPEELRDHARRAALGEVTEDDAAAMRALLAFDLDNDRSVSLDEIGRAARAVRSAG